MQYLLESGADMCGASSKGETCLHLVREQCVKGAWHG